MSDSPFASDEDLAAQDPLRQDPAVLRAAEALLWARRGNAADHAEKVTRGKWKAARHQRLIAEKVVELLRSGGGVLIVEMPVRHGKSEFCSRRLPTWFLDSFPERQVMLATYEAEFAASWGRKVRNDLLEHQEDLQVRLAFDSTAANDWRTTEGGGMSTAGVGGAFTGKGGHLLIVDDPFKNSEQALSESYREKVWDWYRSTFRTRFEPGAVCVIPMARWHEDDLSGRLQRDPGGDRLEVLRLPGEAEADDPLGRKEGEPLWPERFDLKALEALKLSIGEFWYAALVQQRPVPRTGGMFQREKVQYIPAGQVPRTGNDVRYWDKAATAKKAKTDPDWTAGARMRSVRLPAPVPQLPPRTIAYLLGMERLRAGPEVVQARVLETARLDGRGVRIRMEQEPGSSGVESIEHYRKLLVGFAFKGVRNTGPKEVRAEAMAATVNSGDFFIVLTGDPSRDAWVKVFLDELEKFPRGAKDDQVDAGVGAYQELTKQGPVMAAAVAAAEDAVPDRLGVGRDAGDGAMVSPDERPVGGAW